MRTDRPWGYYTVLYETDGVKVKELVVEPGKSLSMQRHEYRNEHWHIAEGVATVNVIYETNGKEAVRVTTNYYKHNTVHVPKFRWHQLCNNEDFPLKVVEIQYGEKCEEEDIERK